MISLESLEAEAAPDGDFYGADGRAALMMRIAHFPDELLPLLQLEALVASHALQCYRCDAIVELGCYDGRSVEISRSAGVRYLGVDLDQVAIASLRARIAAEGMEGRAEAVVANALHLEQWAGRVDAQRSLIQLPFNFLGGFRHPAVLLRKLCRVPGALLLISVFNTSEYSTRVRERYYTACGVDALTVTRGAKDSATFTGGRRFFSRAYTPDMLRLLFEECSIDPLYQLSNRLGTCVVARPRRPNEDTP